MRNSDRTLKAFLYPLILLPFLGVAGIRNALGTTVYQGWQVMSTLLLFLLFMMHIKEIVLDVFSVSLIVYEGFSLFITTYYHTFSFGIAVITLATILLSLLVKFDGDLIIKTTAILSGIIIIVNFVDMLMHPGAGNEIFFIGGKNQLSMFITPAVFFILLNVLNTKGKVGPWEICFLVFSIATVIMGGSGTGIVVAVITALSLMLNQFFKNKKIWIAVMIVLNLLFLFAFEFLSETEWWIDLTSFLDKSATLTGRTTIWNVALDKIQAHWLFGTGKGTEISYINSMGFFHTVAETHNIFLQVALTTGLVGLVTYAIYLASAFKSLSLENPKQRLIFIAIFICFVNGLTESVNNNMLFILLIAIAYYSKDGILHDVRES